MGKNSHIYCNGTYHWMHFFVPVTVPMVTTRVIEALGASFAYDWWMGLAIMFIE